MQIDLNHKPSILRNLTLFRGIQAYLILLLAISFYYLIRLADRRSGHGPMVPPQRREVYS